MQKSEKVVGVLSGGIEADAEVDGGVALGNPFESLLELGIALGGLGELQFVGCRLQILAQESGVMAIAGGVDADADACWRASRA